MVVMFRVSSVTEVQNVSAINYRCYKFVAQSGVSYDDEN